MATPSTESSQTSPSQVIDLVNSLVQADSPARLAKESGVYLLNPEYRVQFMNLMRDLLTKLSPEVTASSVNEIAFCQEVLTELSDYESELQSKAKQLRKSEMKIIIGAQIPILIVSLALLVASAPSDRPEVMGWSTFITALTNFGLLGRITLHSAGRKRVLSDVREEVKRKMDKLRQRLPENI